MSKNAIVIGATSGIGLGIARCLAANGYQVGITGRRSRQLEELKETDPQHFIPCTMDIMELDRTVAQLEELVARLGSLDLLVISSGFGDINPELDFAIEKQTIATNVMGVSNIAVWGIRYFIRQRFGHLVLLSSVAAIRGSRLAPAYNGSKSFISNYAEGLRQRVNGLPITVTDIRPGFVDTELGKSYPIAFWMASVERASEQIYKAICKKKKIAYITSRWRYAAWIMRLIPTGVYCRMGKRLK